MQTTTVSSTLVPPPTPQIGAMTNISTSASSIANVTAVIAAAGGGGGGGAENYTRSAVIGGGDLNVTVDPAAVQQPTFNGTGYYLDGDETDSGGFFAGFTDIQTLFLACFATLVPLLISLVTAFAVRILWKRYSRARECRDYEEGSLHGEESTEPLSRPLHSHLLSSDKPVDDLEVRDTTGATSTTANRTGNHCSANGSIITMTLKNNHLIVETEERDDLEDDSRETTMKYSPGARDGVFVVEVQQGVRRSPGLDVQKGSVSQDTSKVLSDQCALVHHPPDRYSDEDTLEEGDEDEYYGESSSQESVRVILARCKTGLSQSNQSISSEQNYRYGNQQGYDNGHYGYPVYNGYTYDEPTCRLPEPNKPKITSALYKPRLESAASIDPGPDGPLCSDAAVKKFGLAHVAEDEALQEEQRRLGNGVVKSRAASGAAAAATATSPPPLTTQIKELLPSVSAASKFERLKNDLSPSTQDFELAEAKVNKGSATGSASASSKQYQNAAFESS